MVKTLSFHGKEHRFDPWWHKFCMPATRAVKNKIKLWFSFLDIICLGHNNVLVTEVTPLILLAGNQRPTFRKVKRLMYERVCAMWLAAQLCPTFCNPKDCGPPGISVHGDCPGNSTGVGCHALLQGIFPTQDRTQVSCIAGGFFTS